MYRQSEEYKNKVAYGCRRKRGRPEFDQELSDLIAQARAELLRVGVAPNKVMDEDNPLILGAVKSYARWHLNADEEDAVRNREEFYLQAENLRKSK